MKLKFNRSILGMLLSIASISLLSCNSQNKENQNSQNTEITAENTTDATSSLTNDVSFIDENGKDITLSSLKGKVVFINFWATWCPPCIREMPSINSLKESFKDRDDIVFLMVDVDGTMEKSKGFMTENNYNLQVYIPKGEIPSNFLGNAIPTTVILNKNGELVNRMEGGRDYAAPEIIASLNELLQSN
ncbi:TlpA family protein disulfide reductase [Sphingobacterium sp. SG20118]|uniref:TlpA family protein disulfide reductase n=1 Tax=Sphingobacterium TaxID=28453 RepID=UPI0004F8779A|nr:MULTISPECIES: TlpA disulfide reductase family protein [Sphingobacterium]AIM36691.1 thioredoxin [Sphingobacterium sp. ML3W]MDH5827127.1 TlpA disulfide reductase family protein [Sphingobacterium faecium]